MMVKAKWISLPVKNCFGMEKTCVLPTSKKLTNLLAELTVKVGKFRKLIEPLNIKMVFRGFKFLQPPNFTI